MAQNHLKLFATSALLACSTMAMALPFNSFDPRSMAMGGAGVAVGDASMAPLFNPALLTVTPEEDDFSMDLPIVGVRAYDPSNFTTSLNDFQNGNYFTTLDTSITAYNAAPSPAGLTAIANNTSTLSTQLATLSDKPIQGEAGAGMVIGIPSKSFGAAFYATGWGAVGGIIRYRDNQTLQDFAAALNTASTCVAYPCPALAGNPYIDPITGQVLFNTNTGMQSSVDIRGVTLSEVGVAFSREFGSDSNAWGLGITPKSVRVTLVDYSASVNNGTTSNATNSDYTTKYSTANFDLGLAKNYGDGWRAGFVVKNVIPRSYDFKSIAPGAAPGSAQIVTGTMKIRPQARIGGSHSTDWSTVAMDLDLTANDPAGFENKSQYLSLGGELNAWGWAQLRVGYRANLKDSKRNITSVGVGLGPLDISVAGSGNEVGASLALGFTF